MKCDAPVDREKTFDGRTRCGRPGRPIMIEGMLTSARCVRCYRHLSKLRKKGYSIRFVNWRHHL